MLLENILRAVALYFVINMNMVMTLYIDRERHNLTSVPQDIDAFVTHLILRYNKIKRVTNMSFVMYTELQFIDLLKNGLRHIGEGTFHNNAKLEELNAMKNKIQYFPQSFGAAKWSLKRILLWASVTGIIKQLNLTGLETLEKLDIGANNCKGSFNAALLPRNLRSIGIRFGRLQVFPDFISSTLNIQSIALEKNDIAYIAEEAVTGLAALTTLNLNRNKLHAVPDLYHLPITKLLLGDNLINCNYRKVSNIRRTLVGNKIIDHSDVVGASPVGAAPTTSSFST